MFVIYVLLHKYQEKVYAYFQIRNRRSKKGRSINSSEPAINNYRSGSAVWRSVAILNWSRCAVAVRTIPPRGGATQSVVPPRGPSPRLLTATASVWDETHHNSQCHYKMNYHQELLVKLWTSGPHYLFCE